MDSDLKRAYDALRAKTRPYTDLFNYYDGVHPLLYTNKRLEEIFSGLDARFTENWCGVIVDAVKDRVNLAGLSSADQAAANLLDSLWESSEIGLESDSVHEAALVAGEGYFIAWPDDEGQVQGYANDPRLCHAFYEPGNPRKMQFAAKWWTDGSQTYMTLYYPDRLEYYVAKSATVENFSAFVPAEVPQLANPYGEIPVFHFQLNRRSGMGLLQNVIPIQNGINKLLTDMMVAAEYGAFSQRWVISNADTLGKLKNAPNEIWSIPSGDGMGQGSSVGQFQATDLNNYLASIDNLAGSLAAITRTPRHYFFRQGGDPSGEALIAMESPLNKKSQDAIDRFSPIWRRAAAFMARLSGMQVDSQDISADYTDPETIQPRTEAEITQIRVNTGIPLVTALRDEGWTQDELDQMEQDKAAEQAASQTSLGLALIEAERRFNAAPLEETGSDAQPD